MDLLAGNKTDTTNIRTKDMAYLLAKTRHTTRQVQFEELIHFCVTAVSAPQWLPKH
jgi:mannose-6-phosphate isomerase-like protein (cupin superfamily)